MISSGTRLSDIEEYLKANLTSVHNSMVGDKVSAVLVSGTDALSLALVEFFLTSLEPEKLAELGDLEYEILKRNISIKIAQVVMYACKKALD